MRCTPLRFESIQQIVGNDDVSVIILTDEARQRALSIVCDADMTHQITLRLQGKEDECKNMLPEVLWQMLSKDTYELMVVGIFNGQYQVVLMNIDTKTNVRLRMADAILLHLISHIPLYIENGLMGRQCAPFDEKATGVAIPINTMDLERLKSALDHAVEVENYKLASQLRDEIKRRKP
nr:DUF151 domain-containing protein [Prevotella sp.]